MDKEHSEMVSDEVLDAIHSLIEHGRTPTDLELDRFIRWCGYVSPIKPPDDKREAKKEEAQAIIRCVKDAKRVHPDWKIDDIIYLLQFREDTRTAQEKRKEHGKPTGEREG